MFICYIQHNKEKKILHFVKIVYKHKAVWVNNKSNTVQKLSVWKYKLHIVYLGTPENNI